jgi:UDP-glucuronate 4-epimerase
MPRNALVTGAAGFIGSHLVDRLLAEGWHVTAVDNFDDFYARDVKRRNIAPHLECPGYRLVELDIRDEIALATRLTGSYDVIVHLAARAGVRPSIQSPLLYQDVNVRGTANMLEFARDRGIKQFVFASSSSVYGVNPNTPWLESDTVLLPISPYASTKVSSELHGHVYSQLFGIRFIALRFFTVYGPRQRPDLAIHHFLRRMYNGDAVPMHGDGTARRDFTYVADIISGIRSAMDYTASEYEVINLGNGRPVSVIELIHLLAEVAGAPARVQRLPTQPGDVPQTWASIEKASALLGYHPRTSLFDGLRSFADWMLDGSRSHVVAPRNVPTMAGGLQGRAVPVGVLEATA